jgi:hypothetical protein
MKEATSKLWDLQNRHQGDRIRLFRTVRAATGAERVLYPGSFVDVAASAVFPDVTYADIDRRAETFFQDEDGVREIVETLAGDVGNAWSFVAGDYRELDLERDDHDLLISLYAGFVSEHCTQFLRIGGALLVNPSHGDVAMAALDPRYGLAGVVLSRGGDYTVRTDALDTYLIPKTHDAITPELLHQRGRGVAYTRSAFAYLFRRVS